MGGAYRPPLSPPHHHHLPTPRRPPTRRRGGAGTPASALTRGTRPLGLPSPAGGRGGPRGAGWTVRPPNPTLESSSAAGAGRAGDPAAWGGRVGVAEGVGRALGAAAAAAAARTEPQAPFGGPEGSPRSQPAFPPLPASPGVAPGNSARRPPRGTHLPRT